MSKNPLNANVDDHFSSYLKTYFFDTSALVKLYKHEQGSQKVREIFDESDGVYTSSVAIGEVFNILKNKLKPKEWREKAMSVFCQEIASGKIRILNPETGIHEMRATMQDMEILHEKYSVDFTDALHFLIMEKELRMLVDLFIVCADKRFCKLLEDKGFNVINPEDYD